MIQNKKAQDSDDSMENCYASLILISPKKETLSSHNKLLLHVPLSFELAFYGVTSN